VKPPSQKKQQNIANNAAKSQAKKERNAAKQQAGNDRAAAGQFKKGNKNATPKPVRDSKSKGKAVKK